MLPHSWISGDLWDSRQIGKILHKNMESCQTILASNNEEPATVNIKRGIFQENDLSSCFFISLIILYYVLKNDQAGYNVRKEKRNKINHLLET